MSLKTSDFDFKLPPERIALRPAVPPEAARLLVVGDDLQDRHVSDLANELRSGDILVFNDTKVIPASLSGKRIGRLGTAPKIAVLLHKRLDATRWRAFAKPGKKLLAGDVIEFSEDLRAVMTEKGEAGEIELKFDVEPHDFEPLLLKVGRVPLPPYIGARRKQDAEDIKDYQTIFAEKSGAVAAPTAGLHFTPDLMDALQQHGISREIVTLHVGAGTFLPVKAEELKDHKMHSEWGEVSAATAQRLAEARGDGRRVIAVGTTSLRILETSGLLPFAGFTNIFITPGYKFRAVDGLITNFHLPRSTLFMLVSAFAGKERMSQAYAHAIARNYRFYSYGDASLLWPQHE